MNTQKFSLDKLVIKPNAYTKDGRPVFVHGAVKNCERFTLTGVILGENGDFTFESWNRNGTCDSGRYPDDLCLGVENNADADELEPFSIEEYEKGRPVVLKDGTPVNKILGTDRKMRVEENGDFIRFVDYTIIIDNGNEVLLTLPLTSNDEHNAYAQLRMAPKPTLYIPVVKLKGSIIIRILTVFLKEFELSDHDHNYDPADIEKVEYVPYKPVKTETL